MTDPLELRARKMRRKLGAESAWILFMALFCGVFGYFLQKEGSTIAGAVSGMAVLFTLALLVPLFVYRYWCRLHNYPKKTV